MGKLFSASDLTEKKAAGNYSYADCGDYIVEIQDSGYFKSPDSGAEGLFISSKVLHLLEQWVVIRDKEATTREQRMNSSTYAPADSKYAEESRKDDSLTVEPCSTREGVEHSDMTKKNSMFEPTVKKHIMGLMNMTESELDEFLGSEEKGEGDDFVDIISEKGGGNPDNPLAGIVCHMQVRPKTTKQGRTVKNSTYRPLTVEEMEEYGYSEEGEEVSEE